MLSYWFRILLKNRYENIFHKEVFSIGKTKVKINAIILQSGQKVSLAVLKIAKKQKNQTQIQVAKIEEQSELFFFDWKGEKNLEYFS